MPRVSGCANTFLWDSRQEAHQHVFSFVILYKAVGRRCRQGNFGCVGGYHENYCTRITTPSLHGRHWIVSRRCNLVILLEACKLNFAIQHADTTISLARFSLLGMDEVQRTNSKGTILSTLMPSISPSQLSVRLYLQPLASPSK